MYTQHACGDAANGLMQQTNRLPIFRNLNGYYKANLNGDKDVCLRELSAPVMRKNQKQVRTFPECRNKKSRSSNKLSAEAARGDKTRKQSVDFELMPQQWTVNARDLSQYI